MDQLFLEMLKRVGFNAKKAAILKHENKKLKNLINKINIEREEFHWYLPNMVSVVMRIIIYFQIRKKFNLFFHIFETQVLHLLHSF